jgi:hypothetical protein
MNAVIAAGFGLRFAFKLACGLPDGTPLAEADRRGAGQSFLALLVCLPVVVSVRALSWFGGIPPGAMRALSRDLLIFGVSWLAFAAISWHLVPMVADQKRWPRFIVAWNWCNVVENLLIVVGMMPGALGAPHFADQVAQVFTTGWALWLEWYAIRLTLAVGPLTALWLLVVDESIGLMLSGIGGSFGASP